MSHAIFHVRRRLREPRGQYELMPSLIACASLSEVSAVVERCKGLSDGSIVYGGSGSEERLREARRREARKAANAARRAQMQLLRCN